MREEGEVIALSGKNAKVKIKRKSACGGNCAECGSFCAAKDYMVEAENRINASIGDKVIVEMPSKRVLKAAFLVYILPLIFMIAGYYISGLFIQKEAFCALIGLVFTLISFFALHRYDKKSGGRYNSIVISLIDG